MKFVLPRKSNHNILQKYMTFAFSNKNAIFFWNIVIKEIQNNLTVWNCLEKEYIK